MLGPLLALALAPPPVPCMLPHGGGWCVDALAAARGIDCGSLGSGCYLAVSAMYDVPAHPDPAVVEAADCKPEEPACVEATADCYADVGPSFCVLYPNDSVESCASDAEVAGVHPVVALIVCERLFGVYG